MRLERRRASPGLEAEGWERRFLVDRARAEEAAELFAALGCEVRLEASAAAADLCCAGCREASPLLVTVYTRRRGAVAAPR